MNENICGASNSLKAEPQAGTDSHVESAFSSLAGLFEQSVNNVQLSTEDHDKLAHAFDEQLASVFKALDPSYLGISSRLLRKIYFAFGTSKGKNSSWYTKTVFRSLVN